MPEQNVVVEDESTLRHNFEKNIGDKIHFAFDSYVLSEDAINLLEKQAVWLLAHPNVIARIEGHCDERGDRDYNLVLGLKRAKAVEQVLVARGVDKNRLTVFTYGKDVPEIGGYNNGAWKLNLGAVVQVIIKVR
jgi:peptidoglycan-associated lipoprotein